MIGNWPTPGTLVMLMILVEPPGFRFTTATLELPAKVGTVKVESLMVKLSIGKGDPIVLVDAAMFRLALLSVIFALPRLFVLRMLPRHRMAPPLTFRFAVAAPELAL